VDSTPARIGQRRWRRWFEAGLDLVFPPRFAGCGVGGGEWCRECDSSLLRLRPPLCAQCGAELGEAVACRTCRERRLSFRVRSYAHYAGPVCRAILHLKYRPSRHLADRMAGWLGGLCAAEGWEPTLIVPVPLAERRLRQRGYNQAGLMASALGLLLALPVEDHALRRVRETPSQVGLDPASRRLNVQGAFRGNPSVLHDQAVLLVDDLYTTGATLAACAEAAHGAGAVSVYAVTVARAG
jgi:ComF family protein